MRKKVELVEHQLELNERIDLHKKGWVIQRVGWVFMLLVILAAALGTFGNGILSKATIEKGNAKVEYQRFYRYEAEMPMQIFVRNVHGPATISLPESYVKQFKILRIIPEPQEYFIQSGYVSYIFNASSDFLASFYIRPENPGIIEGVIHVNNTPVSLQHLIYP
ncbi:MAG TPA: hypothetical protein VGN63_05960 [Flavisolibacter sp.]|jgi:hypothetical protein|nr:hypothetical protein [Flavisolibacter sp.]